MAEASFSRVAGWVVRCGDNLVEPEEGAKFRNSFAGEVRTLVGEQALHGAKNQNPIVKEDTCRFGSGDGDQQEGESAKEARHNEDVGVAQRGQPRSSNVSGDNVVVACGTQLLEWAVIVRGSLAAAADAVTSSHKTINVGTLCGPPADVREGIKRLGLTEMTTSLRSVGNVQESGAKVRWDGLPLSWSVGLTRGVGEVDQEVGVSEGKLFYMSSVAGAVSDFLR